MKDIFSVYNFPQTFHYKKKKLILYFRLLSVFLVLSACDNNQEKSADQLSEIEFTINTSLLASKVTNETESFGFHPPRFFAPIPEDSLKIIKAKLQGIEEDNLETALLYLFRDSAGNNSLSISKITFTKNSKKNMLDEYVELIMNRSLFEKAQRTKFLKKNILISQIIVNTGDYVLIKIIFAGKAKSLFQFDYLFMLSDYKNEVRSIESSIGSIILY